jgi:predicted anti-sigma-YlaC factor YlaD
MTCKETIRLICEYLDGRLTPSVDFEIKEHLDQCRDCRTVLQAARKALRLDFGAGAEFAPSRKSQLA